MATPRRQQRAHRDRRGRVRRDGRAGRPPGRGLPGRGARSGCTAAGVDTTCVVDVAGPTVRNWVVYEADGRRHWLYRTPPGRSAEVAPLPATCTPAVADAPASCTSRRCRCANAEAWSRRYAGSEPARAGHARHPRGLGRRAGGAVLALAGAGRPVRAEPRGAAELTGDHDPERRLRALAASRRTRAVVKAGRGRCLRADRRRPRRTCPPWRSTSSTPPAPATRSAAALAAGLAAGLETLSTPSRSAWRRPARRSAPPAACGCSTSDGDVLRELGRDLARPVRAAHPGRAGGRCRGPHHDGDAYDIDVMRREIEMIPDVVSDVARRRRRTRAPPRRARLVERGVDHLWLTGCGDSRLRRPGGGAGVPAAHAGSTPHPGARARPGSLPRRAACREQRGRLRLLLRQGRPDDRGRGPARRFGHPVIALTNAPDGQLGRAVDEVVPLDGPDARLLARHLDVRRDARQPAPAGRRARGAPQGRTVLLGPALERAARPRGRTLELRRPGRRSRARACSAARWAAFLGAGPNEATARFGAAKLFEGPQRLGGRRPTSRSGRTRSTS